MKKILTSTAAICMIALLSACGGGGGSSYSGVENPPVDGGGDNGGDNGGGGNGGDQRPSGPESTAPAALAAWAKDGGNTAAIFNAQGIKRTSRIVTAEDGRHAVFLDGVDGYGDGLVVYNGPNGETIYQLAENSAPMGTPMTGVYTGRIMAEWTPNADIGPQGGEGNVALTLNTETGRGDIDSIIGGSNSNLQVSGLLSLDGNKLSGTDVITQFRDGNGAYIRDEVGVVDANVIGNNGVNAIFGTVISDNANGGFSADLNPNYSLN